MSKWGLSHLPLLLLLSSLSWFVCMRLFFCRAFDVLCCCDACRMDCLLRCVHLIASQQREESTSAEKRRRVSEVSDASERVRVRVQSYYLIGCPFALFSALVFPSFSIAHSLALFFAHTAKRSRSKATKKEGESKKRSSTSKSPRKAKKEGSSTRAKKEKPAVCLFVRLFYYFFILFIFLFFLFYFLSVQVLRVFFSLSNKTHLAAHSQLTIT